jgi:Carbohydrate binding module (family 6).
MKKIITLPLGLILIGCLFFSCSPSTNKYEGKPYKDTVHKSGVQSIPGKIYCAYYDLGGEGIAYHDSTSKNHGSGELNPVDGSYLHSFRIEEGVDVSYTKSKEDTDNSEFNQVTPPMLLPYVGWTEPGEWTKYTVEVEKSGKYNVDMLYTSNKGGKVSISVNDKDVTGDINITSTYHEGDSLGWRQWHHWNIAHKMAEIPLKKGTNTLTLHTVEGGQMNYAWLEFYPVEE